MKTFEPEEIAVLKNERGGRIFRVHAQNGNMVQERSSFPDQQKYQLEVHVDQLVKMENEREAHRLVAVLGYIHDEYGRKQDELLAERNRAFKNAVARSHRHMGDDTDDEG